MQLNNALLYDEFQHYALCENARPFIYLEFTTSKSANCPG
jgi:hypothetical protein